MSSYSTQERIIAAILSRTPFIKKLAKKAYQQLNYFVYKKGITHTCQFPIKKIGSDKNESFFGYYDKSPINKTNQFLIYQETKHNTLKKPDKNKSIDIVLYDLLEKKEKIRLQSFAYNWQQGTKLMWISDTQFSYNSYNEKQKKYISNIIDVNDLKREQTLDYPIYDCINNTALTLSFERLNNIMPDYGYRNNKLKSDFEYTEEGIFKINLDENTAKLLISIKEVINLHSKETMLDAKHWFNHIMISPLGNSFMFLHRWINKGKKYDALITANIDGTNIKCLADDDMVSHCYWVNENEIISYMHDKELGNKYYIIDLKTGHRKTVGKGIIDNFGDGHPIVFKDKLVFDTYPNRSRMKELYFFDLKSEKLNKIGEFYESLKYNEETRCDLHPKFNYTGNSVFIDSVHEGNRNLYQIDLTK